MIKPLLVNLIVGICCLVLPATLKAKDHYIIGIYFSKEAAFFKYPDHLREGVLNTIVQELKPWINGNVADNSYSIVLTELSREPSSQTGLTRILTNFSFDQLTDSLRTVLLYQPAGPACPEELSRLGSLQYINNRLPAATYFENTYFFNVSNEAITKSLGPASADYQRSLELLGSNAGQARYFFNSTMLEDNIATPAVYKVENPADSLYYGSSLDIYLQKHLLTFSEEFIGQLSAVPALQRNLLYERRTLGAETLALFPSSATDSFCMINVLRAMPRLDFLPHHCLFPGSSGNNSVFSIPVTWCLAGTGEAASCGYIQADTTVLLGSTPRQLFPIYDLLRPYLIIRKEYNLENLYRGTCEVTGNLVTGIYDHLPYTDTLAFTISLVPPLHYKKAGHAEVVLDNETLLAKAAAYFSGQSVTQGQVLERLQQGEFRSKLIVILLIAIAVLIIIYYYYFRKKKKG